MILLTPEKILLLHQFLMKETGGLDGLRDEALFDSSVQSVFATFDGNELYPSKEEKAAKLGYALVKNHAFIDGNKRIGVYAMLIFLDVNGIRMIYSDNDIITLGLGIADDSLNYKDVLTWVNRHRDATK